MEYDNNDYDRIGLSQFPHRFRPHFIKKKSIEIEIKIK